MEFDDIAKIMEQWNTQDSDIRQFNHCNSPYHHNGVRVLTLFRKLADFVKEHEPVLLIGSEILNPSLWQQVTTAIDKA